MKKKLTYSSVISIILCIAALLVSAAAAASEFIGRYTYSKLFSQNVSYIVTDSSFEFFESYSKVILLTVLSMIFLIAQISSYKVKKIGGTELSLTFGISLLIFIFSVSTVYSHYSTGGYNSLFSLKNEELFMFLFKEGIEWATAIASLFIILSSIVLLIRLSKERFRAEVEAKVKEETQNGVPDNDKGLVF